jgi:hypothetical protein
MFKDTDQGQTQYEQDMSNRVCNTVMIPVEEYETLRRQVDDLTQYGVKLDNWNDTLQEQLAAMTKLWENEYRLRTEAQADNARLRAALLHISEHWCGNRNDLAAYDALDHILDAAVDALALPQDTSALDARLAQERER